MPGFSNPMRDSDRSTADDRLSARLSATLARSSRGSAELSDVLVVGPTGASSAEAKPGETRATIKPQRAGCRKRVGIAVKRLLEREWRGATPPQLLKLFGSMTLPTLDAASDWAVTISFYLDDDMGWFTAGLTIQIVGGLVWSFMLRREVFDDHMSKRKAWPLALLIGLPGLAPVALAVNTLYTQDAEKGTVQLKLVKAYELVCEALPQLMLQSYVAVSYGRLDPSDRESFDPLLAGSIAISLVGAGASLFGMEAIMRNTKADRSELTELQLSATSVYGVARVLANASMTAMLVFWVALLSCAVKGWAALAAVVVLVGYFNMLNEAIITQIFLGGRGTKLQRRRAAIFYFSTLACMAGTLAAVFFTVPHLDNNYSNSSLPVGGPGDPQHYNCKDRTSSLYTAVASTIATAVLYPLSWLVDSEIGVKGLKMMSWEETVEKDSEGMTEEEVRDAKIIAVWRWADIFADSTLEPAELYRLAQQLRFVARRGDNNQTHFDGWFERDRSWVSNEHNPHSVPAPADGLPKKDREAVRRFWHYQMLCSHLGVSAATSEQLTRKWPPVTMAIADAGAHELTEETFASTLGRKVVRHGRPGLVEGSLAKMADGTFAVLDENPFWDGLVRLRLADGSLANDVGNQDDGSKTQSSAEPTDDDLDRKPAPGSEWIKVDTLTKATAAETDANRAAFKGFDLFPGNVSSIEQGEPIADWFFRALKVPLKQKEKGIIGTIFCGCG
jgi:hypothetical protein